MKNYVLCIGLALACSSLDASASPLIAPVSIAGSGPYSNSELNIINGILSTRGGATFDVDEFKTTYWNGIATHFVIDLGMAYQIDNITAYVDNNDTYQVDFSVDGIGYGSSFFFLDTDGVQTPEAGGQDILTTDPTAPLLIGDLTTAVYIGRPLPPVPARYIRVSAASGDDSYGIGEMQFFGNPIPVPPSASLLFASLAALWVARAQPRRRTQSH